MTGPGLSIGITGHRSLSESAGMREALIELFAAIERAFPGRAWLLLSPLAEGADQIVAKRVLERPEARLSVPLPLPVEEYLRTFTRPEAQRQFAALLARAEQVIPMPPAASHPEAYRLTGGYILDHCDVLVALWDGRPVNGPGGTGEIAAEARRRKLPLAWLHTNDETTPPGCLRVTYENFPNS